MNKRKNELKSIKGFIFDERIHLTFIESHLSEEFWAPLYSVSVSKKSIEDLRKKLTRMILSLRRIKKEEYETFCRKNEKECQMLKDNILNDEDFNSDESFILNVETKQNNSSIIKNEEPELNKSGDKSNEIPRKAQESIDTAELDIFKEVDMARDSSSDEGIEVPTKKQKKKYIKKKENIHKSLDSKINLNNTESTNLIEDKNKNEEASILNKSKNLKKKKKNNNSSKNITEENNLLSFKDMELYKNITGEITHEKRSLDHDNNEPEENVIGKILSLKSDLIVDELKSNVSSVKNPFKKKNSNLHDIKDVSDMIEEKKSFTNTANDINVTVPRVTNNKNFFHYQPMNVSSNNQNVYKKIDLNENLYDTNERTEHGIELNNQDKTIQTIENAKKSDIIDHLSYNDQQLSDSLIQRGKEIMNNSDKAFLNNDQSSIQINASKTFSVNLSINKLTNSSIIPKDLKIREGDMFLAKNNNDKLHERNKKFNDYSEDLTNQMDNDKLDTNNDETEEVGIETTKINENNDHNIIVNEIVNEKTKKSMNKINNKAKDSYSKTERKKYKSKKRDIESLEDKKETKYLKINLSNKEVLIDSDNQSNGKINMDENIVDFDASIASKTLQESRKKKFKKELNSGDYKSVKSCEKNIQNNLSNNMNMEKYYRPNEEDAIVPKINLNVNGNFITIRRNNNSTVFNDIIIQNDNDNMLKSQKTHAVSDILKLNEKSEIKKRKKLLNNVDKEKKVKKKKIFENQLNKNSDHKKNFMENNQINLNILRPTDTIKGDSHGFMTYNKDNLVSKKYVNETNKFTVTNGLINTASSRNNNNDKLKKANLGNEFSSVILQNKENNGIFKRRNLAGFVSQIATNKGSNNHLNAIKNNEIYNSIDYKLLNSQTTQDIKDIKGIEKSTNKAELGTNSLKNKNSELGLKNGSDYSIKLNILTEINMSLTSERENHELNTLNSDESG